MLHWPDSLAGETSSVLLWLIGASVVLTVLSVAFAGLALGIHAWTRVQERSKRQRREEWQHHLLDVLAGERSPETLSAKVAATSGASFLTFLVPYATTVQGQAKQRIREVAYPFLKTVRSKLESSRSLIRAQAVQRIGLLGGATCVDALRERLKDPSPRVVSMAVKWVAKTGDPTDAERILNCLGRLDHVDRRQISSALIELGEEAAPMFRSALVDPDRPSFVRICCAEALRWLGDSASAASAARLLQAEEEKETPDDPELTASLLRLLRRVGQTSHATVVRPYLASDVPFVRIHAARALGQLGDRRDEPLLNALLRGDESRWVALSAARSLVEIDCTEPLIRLRESQHTRAPLATDVLPLSG